jgi:hypothetical protein
MQLWQRLYAMIWLTFFACTLIPRWFGKYTVIAHVVLGVLILGLSLANKKTLAGKPAPDRLKRISAAVAGLAAAQAVLGLTLGGLMRWQELPSWVASVLDGFHVVFSLTMLAQSASLATGYDMWEEKEIGPAPAKTEEKSS